jgi:hypothetical protein
MATTSNITTGWYQGEDFSITFDFAEDITGWTLSWLAKKDPRTPDADAALSKTTADGITIIGTYSATPASNTQRAVVEVDAADTADLRAGSYQHELKRTDVGFQRVLAQGTATLQQALHRTVAT